jgi:hypothetical protein
VSGHPSTLTPQICTTRFSPSASPIHRSSPSLSAALLSLATAPLTTHPTPLRRLLRSPGRRPLRRPSAGPLHSLGRRSPHRPTPPLYVARRPVVALYVLLAAGPLRSLGHRHVRLSGVGPLCLDGPLSPPGHRPLHPFDAHPPP